jgi:hypothetical protein
MASALAIENVSRFSGAFAFAPMRLITAADVGANLSAANDLLLRSNNKVFHNFSHLEVSLRAIQVNRIEGSLIITSHGRLGKAKQPDHWPLRY